MSERIWTDQEIAALKTAEPQLAALGMHTAGESGDYNANVFLKYFELHPQTPVAVDVLLRLFVQLKEKNLIRVKSDARVRFEKTAAAVAPHDLDTLERFLKANRLWPSDDEAYLNACQFMNYMTGRPYTFETLAHLALPQIQQSSREGLRWKTPGASTYRLTGTHSGGDSHFAPVAESNQAFSHRVANLSTQIPRPVSSSKMDAYRWDEMAAALCGDRHAETAAIQHAVKQAGGGEAGYRAGVAMQKRIRTDRERGM